MDNSVVFWDFLATCPEIAAFRAQTSLQVTVETSGMAGETEKQLHRLWDEWLMDHPNVVGELHIQRAEHRHVISAGRPEDRHNQQLD